MATTSARLLLWSPRILGVLISLFIGMFALDAFDGGKPFPQAFADFASHLIPAVLLLALVGASFRWAWIGGVAFIGLAVVYAATVPKGRLDLGVHNLGSTGNRGGAFPVRLVSPQAVARVIVRGPWSPEPLARRSPAPRPARSGATCDDREGSRDDAG
jgi:hypothetical protein